MQATASGCRPVLPFQGEQRCVDLDTFLVDDFLKNHHVDTIILSGRWELSDVPKAIATAALLGTYADNVIVLGPHVQYKQPLPLLLAKAASRGTDPRAFANAYRQAEPAVIDQSFKKQVLPDRVRYLSFASALCQPDCLVLSHDGLPLQFDYGHLTNAGSADAAVLLAQGIPGL